MEQTPEVGKVNNPEIFLAGSYWISHIDLDTFDSDVLIKNLVSQDNRFAKPFLWNENLKHNFRKFSEFVDSQDWARRRQDNTNANIRYDPVLDKDIKVKLKDYFSRHRDVEIMVRQAESLFNLSQLMFALYHGQPQTSTFRDLNLQLGPRSQTKKRDMTKSGFNKITPEEHDRRGGSAYRRALHDLCCDIFESAGLEVIYSIFKNDHMKIIKQKCLDALTNILCVPVIEEYVLKEKSWFLRDLIELIRPGKLAEKTTERLQQDVVPSISVLDRLIVVILSNDLDRQYDIIMDENCIEACLESLENGISRLMKSGSGSNFSFSDDEKKFETIAMQAISLLFHDTRSANWSKQLSKRVINHCLRILFSWISKVNVAPQSGAQNFSSSALLFTLTILVKATQSGRNAEIYKLINYWLNYDNSLLKIITRLTEVRYDDKGERFLDTFDAGSIRQNRQFKQIMNSLTFLYNEHYYPFALSHPYDPTLPESVTNPLKDLSEKVYRRCSNHINCHRREDDNCRFQYPCPFCKIPIYCSSNCKQQHLPIHRDICQFKKQKRHDHHEIHETSSGRSAPPVYGRLRRKNSAPPMMLQLRSQNPKVPRQ